MLLISTGPEFEKDCGGKRERGNLKQGVAKWFNRRKPFDRKKDSEENSLSSLSLNRPMTIGRFRYLQ